MRRLTLGFVLGAATAYFLEPRQGARRRNVTRDRAVAFFRRTGRRAKRRMRLGAAEAHAVKQRVTHLREEPKEFDDVTLAHKVETELFRSPDVPKGEINVNAEDGIVYLRGQVPTPELIRELVSKVQRVQGVREVESLLHLPGTPAPTKEA